MKQLFPSFKRTDIEPANHNHNSYDFFNQCAWKDVENVRRLLNKWFSDIPEEEKEELFNRFKKTFSSAFYELFLYNLFLYQGFKIKVHPKIPNSNKKPDFLIIKNDIEIYVEAKEATDKSESKEALENKLNTLYDSLNKINSQNFLLHVKKANILSIKQPSAKAIIKKIYQMLDTLDPDEATVRLKKYGLDGLPQLNILNSELELEMGFIPIDKEHRHETGRFIGMYPISSYWGGSEGAIKKSFKKKCNRYGALEKPYIIAINAMGKKFSGYYDAENAIWGTAALRYNDNPEEDQMVRMNDGLFYGDQGPIHKNASAVLITKIMPFNIHVSEYWSAVNPFANNPIDMSLFSFKYQYVNNLMIRNMDGKTIGEMMNIEKDWLKR